MADDRLHFGGGLHKQPLSEFVPDTMSYHRSLTLTFLVFFGGELANSQERGSCQNIINSCHLSWQKIPGRTLFCLHSPGPRHKVVKHYSKPGRVISRGLTLIACLLISLNRPFICAHFCVNVILFDVTTV